MRNNPYNPKSDLLRYGIREMVELADTLKKLVPGFSVVEENIGDPVAKGWNAPDFLRRAVAEAAMGDPKVFGYTHSRGDPAARQFVAQEAARLCPGISLDAGDIVFTNGLGAAISVLYGMLPAGRRTLMPQPGYPAHLSVERYLAGAETIGYPLDSGRGWEPDLDAMERQVKKRPEITAILLINPNNPTGAVYSAETIEGAVSLAERHGLMLVSDEVYFRMVYGGRKFVHITAVAKDRAPLVVLRGTSKDVPWPGGRCGWMEFHNKHLDQGFNLYAESVAKRLMLEVCATSLPQRVLPAVYGNPAFGEWLKDNIRAMERNSSRIVELLSRSRGLFVRDIAGAFYIMPLFRDGVLNSRQSLPIRNADARALIEKLTAAGMPDDKRFAFYLLASTGICVVPASDFDSPHPGFRVTALDRDPARLDSTYITLADAVDKYLESAR